MVDIGPFQNIVGVSWPGGDRVAAAQWALDDTIPTSAPEVTILVVIHGDQSAALATADTLRVTVDGTTTDIGVDFYGGYGPGTSVSLPGTCVGSVSTPNGATAIGRLFSGFSLGSRIDGHITGLAILKSGSIVYEDSGLPLICQDDFSSPTIYSPRWWSGA